MFGDIFAISVPELKLVLTVDNVVAKTRLIEQSRKVRVFTLVRVGQPLQGYHISTPQKTDFGASVKLDDLFLVI